jgi:hypothetical protein
VREGDPDNTESIELNVGWAVMSGCDGEDLHFVAFFRRRDRAIAYEQSCRESTNEDLVLIDCDSAVVPAIVTDGRVLLANSFEERKVMQTMAEHVRRDGIAYSDELRRWLEEL